MESHISAKILDASRCIVAKYNAVVVPFLINRLTSLVYNAVAYSGSRHFASFGNVTSFNHLNYPVSTASLVAGYERQIVFGAQLSVLRSMAVCIYHPWTNKLTRL